MVEITSEFDPGGTAISTPTGRRFPITFQGAGLLIWQDEKNFVRLERCKGSDGGIGLIHRVLVEIYKDGRAVGIFYSKGIPEKPVILAAHRKGTAMQFMFAEPPGRLTVFKELALDFNPSILVGISASNLSKQPLTARFDKFSLRGSGGQDVPAQPLALTRLVNTGTDRRGDGTLVLEGAALKVLKATAGTAEPQTNMNRTRSRAEGDGRSDANQCCDMKADLATIGPEATLKARRCRRTDARKTAPRPSLMKLFELLSQD